jgi:hypothetical protein
MLKRGHTFVDGQFYNLPPVAERLKSLNTECVGTLGVNRKEVPK